MDSNWLMYLKLSLMLAHRIDVGVLGLGKAFCLSTVLMIV